MRNGLQDSGVNYSSNYSSFSSSSQYNQPASGNYPYEAAYEQPLPPQASSPFTGAYPPQTSQFSSYRGAEYPAQSQIAQSPIPSYGDQMQQGVESYQQEHQQMQQMLQNSQQYNQNQLLMDLYKTPQGQGRAITSNPGGRSHPFYTADQYINFLNKQHQDVFSQQQNSSDRGGYSFSPMSAYTNGVPATATPSMPSGMSYSPSTNSSRVSYRNGKLSYDY